MPINSKFIFDAVPQFRSELPGYQRGVPPQAPKFNNSILNTAVPGASKLTKSASDIIGNLLQGLPGTSKARRANAYFGINSGLGGGSEFVRNRGFDLYNQEGEANQQRGIQDLLALIGGTTSPLLQERSQDIGTSEFGQQLAENQRRFDVDFMNQERFNRRPRRMGTDGRGSSPFPIGSGAGIY